MIAFFPCNQFVRIGTTFQSLEYDIKYNFNSNCTFLMFSSLYQQSMYSTWCCEFPCSRGFSRNNHICSVMGQILGGGTVGVIACCDTSSDGYPALSCLVYKISFLEFKKAQKQSKYLIPCLNNPTLVSVPHPAHVTLCGSRSLRWCLGTALACQR